MMLPPPIQRIGAEAVLAQGSAVIHIHSLITLGLKAARERDGGIRVPPGVIEIIDTYARAANDIRASMSAPSGHDDVRWAAPAPLSDPTETIGSKEAARMLSITDRHIRRLTVELMGRRGARGNWRFDRGVIEAAVVTRQTKDAAA
ncbi:MAG: hypothetical protein M3N95_04875 [Actinomycetota bacterium]|nr:hypothetical protein [Actinomycetota bacterium]